MRAAVVDQFHAPWFVKKIPQPSISALSGHEVLIKVAVASFCHTDIVVLDGVFQDTPSGLAGSHEPSGTVVAAGSAARKDFTVGDRIIAIDIQCPCGDCIDCNGPEEFWLSCNSEYAVVDSRFAVKIPDSLSFLSAAPLTCAGCTSWRAINRANVRPGAWLGIVGSGGGLGHLAVQIATARGINVIGIDARDGALESTAKAGGRALDARAGIDALVAQTRGQIGPRGLGRGDDLCDATIVLSDAESAIATAIAATKGHGLLVQVAQPERIDLPFQDMIFKDIRLIGSSLSSWSELEELVQFASEHDLRVETSVFHGLESLDLVYQAAISGSTAGKIVVVLYESQV